MKEGFIKLSRKMLKWEWYDDINTTRLFIHCIFRANFKDQEWHGTPVPRGSFISSYTNLAKETHLTVRQVRTALEHLKQTGEVTVKTSNKYSLYTVNNYNLYQDKGSQEVNQKAVKRQTKGSQTTTIEERKERKEGKEEISSLISDYTENPGLLVALQNFAEMRSKDLEGEGKFLNVSSLKISLTKLNGLTNDDDEKIKIVEQSIEKNWKSFYELKNSTSLETDKEGGHGFYM